MNDSNYDRLYRKIIQLSGNELSKFEQYSLLIHAIFLNNNFQQRNNTVLENDWNKEYDKAFFEYDFKINENGVQLTLRMEKDKSDTDKINLYVQGRGQNTNKTISLCKSVNLRDEMCTKIDFDNLKDTIGDLEKFIKSILIEEIIKASEKSNQDDQNNNSANFVGNENNFNTYPYNYGSEVDPNAYLNRGINTGGYNPFPNPYFSTGGGSVGGNLVGPTSDIFIGNMNPRPMPGVHPTVRYDPIGPFGTFGGPQKKPDIKKTDPFFGNDPFQDPFLSNNKKPFGGNPPFGGGLGGGFGGNPWG